MAKSIHLSERTCRVGPKEVSSWAAFDRVIRYQGYPLLQTLDRFPNAILVAGCQRSGTTMLTEVITASSEVCSPWKTKDTELETANVLSGAVSLDNSGRYCFQTTYVNAHVAEYYDHHNYRLVWVLRNPHSVIHSMVSNWRRSALDRLFRACGHFAMPIDKRAWHERCFGLGPSRLEKACYSYVAKVSQIHELMDHLGRERMLVLDYDDLLGDLQITTHRVFEFVGLPYEEHCTESVHARSRGKSTQLGAAKAAIVETICGPAYEAARALINRPGA